MDSRVVHIDSGADWRGGQRQLYMLALEQRSRGMEPLIVSQPRSRLVLRSRAAGIASMGVRMRALWDLAAVRRLRRIFRVWHPQVVHAHDRRALSLAQTALTGMEEIALVFTARALPERGALLRRTGRMPDRFIAPNSDVLQFLGKLGVAAANVDVVPPAVSVPGSVTPRDWRREFRWPADAIVCGVTGLAASAQRTTIREVVLHIRAPLRESLRIVTLGGVPTDETRVAGVPVSGAGFVDEFGPAIAGLDFLCSFSGAESMNTAVIDAMSLRVPPVAYGVGGAGEYIEDRRSGLVVPPGNVVAFAAAVSSLLRDRELRDTLAAFAPGRAARFSAENMGEATARVYHSARGGRQNRVANRGGPGG